jgi:hypothetical protein
MVGMMRFSVLVCVAIALMSPPASVSSVFTGKAEGGQSVQATMLDHNEFPCVNCLFGIADYYFCFDANSKILIGHEKLRTNTRKHESAELMERGKTVPIRFDDKYIWVPQAKGKDLRLMQDYTKKIFLENDRCQAAVK